MVKIQTGMNKGWDAGESFYHHLRFASHTLSSCLVSHMKSEWIRRIIKCSMPSNSASKLIKIGYTCSYPMPASIRVWLIMTLPELTLGCCLLSTELSISKFPFPWDSPGQKKASPAIKIQIGFLKYMTKAKFNFQQEWHILKYATFNKQLGLPRDTIFSHTSLTGYCLS